MKSHKHAELIKKWADGAHIQILGIDGETWIADTHPNWHLDNKYRTKPERKFPKTSLTTQELNSIYDTSHTIHQAMFNVANMAIKQYILDIELDRGDINDGH